MDVWTKVFLTAGVIAFGFVVRAILRHVVHKRIPVPRKLQRHSLQQVFSTIVWILVIIGVISIWSVDVGNLWVFFTSVLGIVAIGFFAVWSILSNVVAGIILLLSQSIRIGDDIVILPDEIKGKVIKINLMFTMLKGKKHEIHIPNNQLFQKFIKKKTS